MIVQLHDLQLSRSKSRDLLSHISIPAVNMKFSTSLALPLLASSCSAAAVRRQNGDGPQGGADATQGDLGARPLPRFPFPILEFPIAKETVVLNETMYIQPGQIFDGQMKRYERPEGSCNEQAEGTDADAVFNLLPGSTIRNVIIGKHQSEGIHALGDAWVENGEIICRFVEYLNDC